MSKNHYTKTWKNCATCTYWSGKRRVISAQTQVEVESTETAACGLNRLKRQANKTACNKWEKWPAIR